MEEESRHHNYAFLMLEVIRERNPSLSDLFFSKTDRALGQFFSTSWVIAELSKVFAAKEIKNKHPFFEVIASCEPLFKALGPRELAKKLFVSAPYISLVINGRNHKKTCEMAKEQKAFSFPFPAPTSSSTSVKLAFSDQEVRHGN